MVSICPTYTIVCVVLTMRYRKFHTVNCFIIVSFHKKRIPCPRLSLLRPSNLECLSLLDADIIVQGVLFILLAMSVGCWVIILNKNALPKNRPMNFFISGILLEDMPHVEEFNDSPTASVYQNAYRELESHPFN